MLHFQYTRNCSIGHFFPLFLPPTYEWPRPTVLKKLVSIFWWAPILYYMLYVAIWPRKPAFYASLMSFYWLWHNLTRISGQYASYAPSKSRQSQAGNSRREIAGAIGTGRKMTSQMANVTLFRPPRITTHSHIHTQVTHKNTTPSNVSLYFNLPEHLQTQEHQLPLPNRPRKHHLAGQEKSWTKSALRPLK